MISKEYLSQVQQLHASDSSWGTSGRRYAKDVYNLICAHEAKSVLDFGAGKGGLLDAVSRLLDEAAIDDSHPVKLHNYDPAVPGFDTLPKGKFDLLVSTDVLEHIEPEHLDEVLATMAGLTGMAAFLVIHTGPAIAKLPDGRNAHLIQRAPRWWMEQLEKHWRELSRPIQCNEVTFKILAKA